MDAMKNNTRAMLAAGGAYSIFGLSYLFSKMALGAAEPSLLLAVRFAVTFLALNLMLLCRAGRLRLKGKPVGMAVLMGVLQPVLYFLLENYGLKYAASSFAGVVSSISPALAIALGALILRERPTLKQWICAGLSMLGVMLISLMNAAGGSTTAAGCLCLLGAYTVGALHPILARKLSKEFTAFEMTYIMFAVGFACFTALAAVQYGAALPGALREAFASRDFTVGVLYLGLLSSVAAYLLINYSLKYLPVAASTIFGGLATVVSVLAGVFIGGETFTLPQALAAALILFGVWGVNRFRADN